jgi:hypothetical protein
MVMQSCMMLQHAFSSQYCIEAMLHDGLTWAPTPCLGEVPFGFSMEYMRAKLSPFSPKSICRHSGSQIRAIVPQDSALWLHAAVHVTPKAQLLRGMCKVKTTQGALYSRY